ncbi:MAG: hypothetical protein AAB969_03985 [Patescibacteria group bacterium]
MMNEEVLVLVESPFAGDNLIDIVKNIRYARACLHDSLLRGEYPFASHLLYTQTGVLRDNVPDERQLGIKAGLAWGRLAQKTVVYTDLVITGGMTLGLARANEAGLPIEFSTLSNFQDIIHIAESLTF